MVAGGILLAGTVLALYLTFGAMHRWVPGDPYSLSPFLVYGVLAAAYPVVVLVHEVGHAVAGAAVGFRPFRVSVGTGPRLVRFVVARTTVEINAFLFSGGSTELGTDRPRAIHARHIVSVLGGPVLPLVMALLLLQFETGSDAGEVIRASLIGVAVYTSLASLLPTTQDGMFSDGRLILESIRARPEHTRALLSAHDTLVFHQAIDAQDHEVMTSLGSSSNAVVASAARITSGDLDGAVDLARAALETTQGDERQVIVNNLALALAKRGGADDLDEALALLQEIDDPVVSWVADTVGFVLLRAGRPAEALPYLRSAAADADLPAHVRAEVFAHLAEAAFGAGDPHSGRLALSRALRHDRTHDDVVATVGLVAEREAEIIGEFWASLDGDDTERAAEISTALGESLPATLAALRHHAVAHPEIEPMVQALAAPRPRRTERR